ncbi:hypothetical protein DGWBC_0561 [Dehalogenimonas sp. WBC-2]|nr:hypothetical protein DGWBC_0561 [Dehalogenimonas sp. WBC-2]
MTYPLDIRPLAESELPQLTRLIQDTIKHSYGECYPPGVVRLFTNYHSTDKILKDVTTRTVLVGWLDSIPVATGSLIGDYVSRVFVHRTYQARSYGKMMAEEIEKLAAVRDIKCLELTRLSVRAFFGRPVVIMSGLINWNWSKMKPWNNIKCSKGFDYPSVILSFQFHNI